MNLVIFLTIAIPTYKSINTLIRLLNSVKFEIETLSTEEVEIIISDNDPESDLNQVLNSTFDAIFLKQITYYRNDKNLGYDGNLAILVQRSTGRYIKFIADDDQLKKGFLKNHIHLIQENLPDVIICNFDSIAVQSGVSNTGDYHQKLIPTVIAPPWNYEKLLTVEGRYGQISTLTFRKETIAHLKQVSTTNFIHSFWFFSILENSKVVYDPNPAVNVFLGSPNFSSSFYQVIEIPFQGVASIRQATIASSSFRKSILHNEMSYAFKGLRLFPELIWSDRLKLLWKNRFFLASPTLLKYVPYVVLPKSLKLLLKKIRGR